MAWDFSTDPEFQAQLDWVEQFCAEVREARNWTEFKHKKGLVERIVTRVTYNGKTREWTAEIRLPYTANAIKSGGQKWDRGVGADAERQYGHGQNGEAGILAQGSQADSQVHRRPDVSRRGTTNRPSSRKRFHHLAGAAGFPARRRVRYWD